MKEYKIWKFNKFGYLQTVTVSLEEEYPYLVSRRSEINLSTDNNTVIGIHVKNRVFINSK